ncbi:hypothetical protein MPTK1_3g00230 [Marchantia polymorpha subsp. ruderalis]|uniref:Glycosyltransferase family 92 protein n=2 Tax=Marchantia polymorpha TaxID=3197 RepID=A0AAF6AVT8_MARPO|nr:hypothetical protein MARPO_0007s0020 [Marchantia polymorpha]BBN03872.1 hypothetical protein Mp_3g00230 [Marchantia polymorpha subsp. ruderalis]|eukprot:PTQ47561.1 hypothetical protein MARPO_0007s0020 [Marchantia polymorpha]
MAPSKGRDLAPLRDMGRDLPQLRRESAPIKGRAMNRKSSGWMGTSWRTLLLGLIFLVLAATTLMISQVFDDKLHPAQIVKGLPFTTKIMPQQRILEDTTKVLPHSSGLLSVRDIVAFPDEVMLLVRTVYRAPIPRKSALMCMFGKKERTGIYTIEWKDESRTLLAVRCEHPTMALNRSKDATLVFSHSNIVLPTAAQYLSNSSWKPLVYETLTLADSVLLFAKGLVDSQGRPNNHSKELHKLHCSFGQSEHGGALVQTAVKVIAQEVVRCALPPPNVIQQLKGMPVSLFVPKIGALRSVAYFDIPASVTRPRPASPGRKRFFVCACTMLWNQAHFLTEWIMYHGFLGIEKWFLYDNNSDDNIDEVLDGLAADYNVSRIAWPWIKTQEAGFSHCALRAKADCEWVLFADVDEFVYPTLDLQQLLARTSHARTVAGKGKKSSTAALKKVVPTLESMTHYLKRHNTSIVRNLIERTLQRASHEKRKVGEVRLVCHNFGPSHLKAAPQDGVTVGYTCRMKWPQRHKSFVLLDALSDTLLNVVHHFRLADGYKEMAVHARVAVINHYKYQAWEVFKAKFVRRVATYVVDWRQQTALSNDRAPGLGTEAVEPPDWPSRYCEEQDHGLRNFTLKYFRTPAVEQKMLWQKRALPVARE